MPKTKFIFIAGGVMSGIGKGVAAASIGRILKNKGFSVTAIKIDPYINVDAGTMNPIEHGEVFVTDDGDETDQDIGNYERFLGENIGHINYITTGRVYRTVIEKERNLEYSGKCVEVVPHIPEEVIRRIQRAARVAQADFAIIEIGGTVGEYQNLIFLEAARIMKLRHKEDDLFILVSYLPVPKMIGEMKTKPTQWAVKSLNSSGIQPDIIVARSEVPLDEPRKRKISIFCNMEKENVISAPDIESIYDVPINFEKDNLSQQILRHFKLRDRKIIDYRWERMVRNFQNSKKEIDIAVVGKYFETGDFTLSDSYISVIEAIKHAANYHKIKVNLIWLDSQKYERDFRALNELKNFKGIIVPGGFGKRGVEGKISTIKFCREKKIPFLGLCYGMQLAVVEFARNVCRMKGAHSTEAEKQNPYPVIDSLPEQKALIREKRMGGSMRLGGYECDLKPGTKARMLYNQKNVRERHRHRYEVNNKYLEPLIRKGLLISGINPERELVEIIEIKNHPFFMGVQFHPEFTSRPLTPHPLFKGFIEAAKER